MVVLLYSHGTGSCNSTMNTMTVVSGDYTAGRCQAFAMIN